MYPENRGGGVDFLYDVLSWLLSMTLYHSINLLILHAGFTPMVKVIRDMGSQGNNKKTTKLLFANKKEKDIPWRKELDQLAQSCDG